MAILWLIYGRLLYDRYAMIYIQSIYIQSITMHGQCQFQRWHWWQQDPKPVMAQQSSATKAAQLSEDISCLHSPTSMNHTQERKCVMTFRRTAYMGGGSLDQGNQNPRRPSNMPPHLANTAALHAGVWWNIFLLWMRSIQGEGMAKKVEDKRMRRRDGELE